MAVIENITNYTTQTQRAYPLMFIMLVTLLFDMEIWSLKTLKFVVMFYRGSKFWFISILHSNLIVYFRVTKEKPIFT